MPSGRIFGFSDKKNTYRPPVKAGTIRFAHAAPETHSVEYLGDIPTEYVRIELRTEPLDIPFRDVRIPPAALDPSKSTVRKEYENGQIRILRVVCAGGQKCPESENPDDPSIVAGHPVHETRVGRP